MWIIYLIVAGIIIFYVGGIGLDIFSDAYESGNVVKFFVSLAVFFSIPVLTGISFLILSWIDKWDTENEERKLLDIEQKKRSQEKRMLRKQQKQTLKQAQMIPPEEQEQIH